MGHSAQPVSASLAKAAACPAGLRPSTEYRGVRAEGAARGRVAAVAPAAAVAVAR